MAINSEIFTILSIVILLSINCVSTIETIDELCENSPVGTKIPHPEDCNLYLKCTTDNDESFAMVVSCQRNVNFNPITLECDPDYSSEMCPGRGTTQKKPTKKSTTKLTTKLITKLTTTKIRSTTKKSNTTKPSTEVPTTIDIVTTTLKPSSIPITTADPKIITCPTDDSPQVKFINNTEDCSKYYICYHGNPLPLRCWNGLHFSTKLLQCVPPEIAQCEANTIPVPVCPKFGTAILPHHNNCRYFYFCFNGIKTVQQCGLFDHWDLNERKCKRKEGLSNFKEI